jgi:cyclin-dependent kinase
LRNRLAFPRSQVLGTPTEESWPGVTALQDWNPAFPLWPRKLLSVYAPGLSAAGLDLLEKLLVYAPSRRVSAKKALLHPYFDGFTA